MNRFVLDYDPYVAAGYHCDKHVVKMILEEAQMLSTVQRKFGYEGEELYKAAYKNHPCTVWAGESNANYNWAYTLFVALLNEYTLRYNKIHSTARLIDALALPPKDIPIGKTTTFPQAMPEDVKSDDTVQAYRAYYLKYKSRFAKWKFTYAPEWWVFQ